jgi:predicted dehydrogenase
MVLGNSDPDPVQGFRFLTGTRQSGKLEVSLIEASQQSGPTEDGRVVPVSRLVGRFLDWVADGIPSTPNFRDGLRAQELLAAAIGSDADSGRRVVIPEKI